MTRRVAHALAALGACVLAAEASGLAGAPRQALAQRIAPAPEQAGEPAVYRLGALTVGDVWAHQSSSRDGAAYFRIENAGEEDDALIDASTPLAKRVELRGPAPGGEVWETGRLDAIPVRAGQVTDLTASALLLRLVGLRGLLRVGGTVRITLTFEQAGAITVEARMLSANAAAAIIEKTMPGGEGAPETPRAPAAAPAPPDGRQ